MGSSGLRRKSAAAAVVLTAVQHASIFSSITTSSTNTLSLVSSSRFPSVVTSVDGQKTVDRSYDAVALQFLEDECIPYPRKQFIEPLAKLESRSLEAMQALHVNGPGEAFGVWMESVYELLSDSPYSAFECPLVSESMEKEVAMPIASLSLWTQYGNPCVSMVMPQWLFKLRFITSGHRYHRGFLWKAKIHY